MIKQTIATAFFIVAFSTSAMSQSDSNVVYSFSAMLGGGYAYDVSEFDSPPAGLEVNRNQYSIFARIMWHPEHLLSAGIEGGYCQFYSLEADGRGKATRSALPFYIVMSMRVFEGLSASTGFGVAFENSTVQGGDEQITGSAVSFAVMGALSYMYPLGDKFSLGAEVRYSSIDLYDDRLFSASALVKYRFNDY